MSDNLYRTRINKVAGGVAAGLAEYFKTDLMLVRILFIILTFFNGIGLVIYLILWIVLPVKPYDEYVFSMGVNATPEGEQAKFATEQSSNNGKLYFGALLILLGVLFLIEKIIPAFTFWDIIPFLLIVSGLFLLFNSMRKKDENRN